MKHNIINIGIIGHVDCGKSTLIDTFLYQSNVFRENKIIKEYVMFI